MKTSIKITSAVVGILVVIILLVSFTSSLDEINGIKFKNLEDNTMGVIRLDDAEYYSPGDTLNLQLYEDYQTYTKIVVENTIHVD